MTRITYPDGIPPRAGLFRPCDSISTLHDWSLALHWSSDPDSPDSYSKRWGPCRLCGEPYVEPPIPPRPVKVGIRATHPYGFRSGEWAVVTGLEWINERPCYQVRFPDGKTDSWVVNDPSDPYEFRSS